MNNKTYKFILIDKNNMKEIRHFTDVESVMSHLWDKKMRDIVIMVNEKEVLHPSSVEIGDYYKVKSALRKKLNEMVA